MESDEEFYKAMVAFCRQHAKLHGENERFWLDEAQVWADRLKPRNAFWHQFAGQPKRVTSDDVTPPNHRQHRTIDRE
jgi:hypothetical protein